MTTKEEQRSSSRGGGVLLVTQSLQQQQQQRDCRGGEQEVSHFFRWGEDEDDCCHPRQNDIIRIDNADSNNGDGSDVSTTWDQKKNETRRAPMMGHPGDNHNMTCHDSTGGAASCHERRRRRRKKKNVTTATTITTDTIIRSSSKSLWWKKEAIAGGGGPISIIARKKTKKRSHAGAAVVVVRNTYKYVLISVVALCLLVTILQSVLLWQVFATTDDDGHNHHSSNSNYYFYQRGTGGGGNNHSTASSTLLLSSSLTSNHQSPVFADTTKQPQQQRQEQEERTRRRRPERILHQPAVPSPEGGDRSSHTSTTLALTDRRTKGVRMEQDSGLLFPFTAITQQGDDYRPRPNDYHKNDDDERLRRRQRRQKGRAKGERDKRKTYHPPTTATTRTTTKNLNSFHASLLQQHSALKKPSTAQTLLQPLVYPNDYTKYTIRINTYHRNEQLLTSINHHSRCEGVAEIHVIWCDEENEPPPEVTHHSSGKVIVERHSVNTLNERFHVLARGDDDGGGVRSMKTVGVLSLDDDVLRPCEALDVGFFEWTKSPSRIVGYDARVHVEEDDGWKYGGNKDTYDSNRYSMVLLRSAFLHRDYLHYYTTHLPRPIYDTVSQKVNCEDIAMSLLVTAMTDGQPPLLADKWAVKSMVKLYSPKGAISGQKGHKAQRHECVDQFSRLLGLHPVVEDDAGGTNDGDDDGEVVMSRGDGGNSNKLGKAKIYHGSRERKGSYFGPSGEPYYEWPDPLANTHPNPPITRREIELRKEIATWTKSKQALKRMYLEYKCTREAVSRGLVEKTSPWSERWNKTLKDDTRKWHLESDANRTVFRTDVIRG